MLVRKSLASLLLLAVRPIHAADGPIDWTKTPGGGPSTLRACAQYPFIDGVGYGGSINQKLGCKTIACLCRPDLINNAYDQAKYLVTAMCGEDSAVDLAAVIKVYNDYCSSNGFAIPGYTYVSTLTLRVSSSTRNEAAVITSPTQPATTGARPTLTSNVGGSPTITTPNGGNFFPGPTATVTIYRSDGSPKARPGLWAEMIYLAVLMPKRLIYALPNSIIETYTAPPDPTGASIIVTATIVEPGAPGVVIHTVFDDGSRTSPTSQTARTTKSTTANVDAKSNDQLPPAQSSGKDGGLTLLEKVGIILGIFTGVITTVATVYMCHRKERAALR